MIPEGGDKPDMQNPESRFIPVTVDSWKTCIALELAPGQEDFVPSNLFSIAEAQFYPDAMSNAIYTENGQLIGYALNGRDASTEKWKIFRIMIDKFCQRKGNGESALRAIIGQISKKPDGNEILVSYQADNQVARRLYAKLGFVEQEKYVEGRVTALLRLKVA